RAEPAQRGHLGGGGGKVRATTRRYDAAAELRHRHIGQGVDQSGRSRAWSRRVPRGKPRCAAQGKGEEMIPAGSSFFRQRFRSLSTGPALLLVLLLPFLLFTSCSFF